jgi:hypothetical protein
MSLLILSQLPINEILDTDNTAAEAVLRKFIACNSPTTQQLVGVLLCTEQKGLFCGFFSFFFFFLLCAIK